jgi:hypothetical protein
MPKNPDSLRKLIEKRKEKLNVNNKLKIISIHSTPALTAEDLDLYYQKINKFHQKFIVSWNEIGVELIEVILDELNLTPKMLKDPKFDLAKLIQEKFEFTNNNLISRTLNSMPSYVKKGFVSSDLGKMVYPNQFEEMEDDIDDDIDDYDDDIDDYEDDSFSDNEDSDINDDIEQILSTIEEEMEEEEKVRTDTNDKFLNFFESLNPKESKEFLEMIESLKIDDLKVPRSSRALKG